MKIRAHWQKYKNRHWNEIEKFLPFISFSLTAKKSKMAGVMGWRYQAKNILSTEFGSVYTTQKCELFLG